jgi:MFS family permease
MAALILPAAASLSPARWAVGAFFFVFGVFIATWVPHIPLAKERLDVSPGWFGAALLMMGGGGILGMLPVGWLINRWGSARVLSWTAPLAGACLPLLALAPSYWAFVLALGTFGALAGMTDVAMNAHGLEVEKRLGRPVMSGFHGLFSVAGLLAAGVAALLIERFSEPERMLLSTALCVGLSLLASRFLLPAEVDRGTTNNPLALPNRATVGLGLLALLALLIEGAVLDWAGIHLRATFAADASLTSLLVSAFFGCMAISRLSGDWLRGRLGAARVLRHSAWATALMLVLALLSPSAPVALVFFALSGLTLGLMAPVLFAAGGQADPEHAGRGMAAVVSLGYVGLIAGPAVVGFIAQASNLGVGLAVVAGFSVVIWVFGGAARVADGRS